MIKNVRVQEWMSSPVISVEPSTPIGKAHQVMKDQGVRRLVVVEEGIPKGIVTIGDVREASPSGATTLSIWELNYLWAKLTVDKIMKTKLVTVRADDPISEAARLMLEYKISGLPVLDANEQLVGIITESDIFRMLVKTAMEEASSDPVQR
jgi:acetoin utilization protein AcuB